MIFKYPVVRRTGDLSLTIEFGDEVSLEASFRVLALAQQIKIASIPHVVETIPTHRSLGVVVDANAIGTTRLSDILDEEILQALELRSVPSRIVRIPMLYDDFWSTDCAVAHKHENSFSAICRENQISPEEVIERHTGTDHWVGAVGFTPGCTQAFPLDESHIITATKCPVPRTWTYSRIVGLGGRLTAPYTVESPGGYQMLGRTPLDWYDPSRKNSSYGDDITLCRVGDRQRFEAVDLRTYEAIREAVVTGSYEYQIEQSEMTLPERAVVQDGADE